MNYQIGNVSINSHTGAILDQGMPKAMRPKTLQVLLYLLRNRHRTVTTQELMQAIWHDVVTREYVLYQSITEIRSFFQDQQVVRTFPRQGYQWIAAIEETAPARKPNCRLPYAFAAMVLLALTPIILYSLHTLQALPFSSAVILPAEVAVEQHTIILNPLVDTTEAGHEVSGTYSVAQTELLAEYLHALPHIRVQAAPRQEPSPAITPLAEMTATSSYLPAPGANIFSLHTRLYKQTDEYHLHYVLLGARSSIRGVIFSNTVPASLSGLAASLGQIIGNFSATTQDAFAGEALFLGMEAFLQQDYALAETFLHTAAILQPDALPSWRYLSRAQILQGKFNLASTTIREALNTITFVPKNGFELRLLNQLRAIANPLTTPQESPPGDGIA